MIPESQVYTALEIYDAEFSAWTITPIHSTRYEESGRVEYQSYFIENTKTREQLAKPKAEAEVFRRFRAIEAVLESVK